MKETNLRYLAQNHLIPLVPGVTLSLRSTKGAGRKGRVIISEGTAEFRVDENDPYFLLLKRGSPFNARMEWLENQPPSETAVLNAFVEAVKDIEPLLRSPFRDEILSGLGNRIVAIAAAIAECGSRDHTEAATLIRRAINQLAVWATRTYEGGPITSALAFDFRGIYREPVSVVTLEELCTQDFIHVLTDGMAELLMLACDLGDQFHQMLKFVEQIKGTLDTLAVLCPESAAG